ncbi:uncharacterized protein [Notamacropus eugenii]|uniref:uncharacterized protein n=1 Tax=Notamacropus eugenii TaxID=9315 RepID=UPI003B66B6F7
MEHEFFSVWQLEDLLTSFAGQKNELSSLLCGIQVLGFFCFCFWFFLVFFFWGLAAWKISSSSFGLEYKYIVLLHLWNTSFFWVLVLGRNRHPLFGIQNTSFPFICGIQIFFWWFGASKISSSSLVYGIQNLSFFCGIQSLSGGLFGAWKISSSSLVWNTKSIVLCGIQGIFGFLGFFCAWKPSSSSLVCGIQNLSFLICRIQGLSGGLFGAWKISSSSLVCGIQFICGIQDVWVVLAFVFGFWVLGRSHHPPWFGIQIFFFFVEYKFFDFFLFGWGFFVLGRFHHPWFGIQNVLLLVCGI